MECYKDIDYTEKIAFLLIKDLEVIDINNEACDLLKFSREDMLGKHINEISEMLRCNFDLNTLSFKDSKSLFIFNGSCDPIEITLEIDALTPNEILCFFKEVPNSKIEDKMPLFSHLFKSKDHGIAVFSVPDIKILKANQIWLNFLDKPFNKKERSIGRKISEVIKGWTGSSSEDIWRKVLQSGKSFHIDEYEFPFERGTTYWEASLIPIYENGSMKYVVEITRDITEKVMQRNIMEEQVRIIDFQKRQLEALFENIKDIVYVVDKEGTYLYLHKLFQDFFKDGKPKTTDCLYKSVEFYNLEGRKLSLEELPSIRVRNGEKLNNHKIMLKDGTKAWYLNITGTPVYDEKGIFQMGIIVSHDITEDILKSRLIEEQKEQLNAIIANSSDGLVMLDKNKNVKILNEAAKRFFYKPELIKKAGDAQPETTYYDLNGDPISFEKFPGVRALEGEKVETMRLIAKRPDKTLNTSINGSPIYDSKGELTGSLFSIRYLDEVVRYEEILKQQRDELERLLQMKEEFFSYMSHEFKTPLTVMTSTIQLMKLVYKNEISEKVMKYINKLNQSALQQLRLVNNILDITRGDSGYLKANQRNLDIVSMTRAISDSVTNFALRKNVKIQYKTEIPKLTIAIDDEKYERILLNLLSNAIKFTPEGKSIYINLSVKDEKVLIDVQDEGVGIPEDKIDVIFERFGQVNNGLTRDREGTGIGLCLVKVLVEALNGDIKVESRVGEGSKFTIYLPIKTIQEETTYSLRQLADNRLVETMDIEFSNIYLE